MSGDHHVPLKRMVELIRFKRERTINILQDAGVKLFQFGVLLLGDHSGARINVIAIQFMNRTSSNSGLVAQHAASDMGYAH